MGIIAGPYSVGGTLTGLTGTVVLQNNSGDDLTLTDDGNFTFETPVEDGETYAVTVFTQPDTKTCSVSSGSGTIDGANITNVSVVCATDTYTVGGTLTGLSGTVVLQNNAGDDLTLTSDGTFTFDTEVANGAGYEVTVLTQPDSKTCSVSSGSGTIDGADVTNVSVVCATDTYTVGGTLTGVSGTVVLQNNSGDNLSLTSNGTFTFATEVADGAGYAVTVLTQPSLQTCTVASGSGTIDGADVTNVSVSCMTTNLPTSFTLSVGTLLGADNGCDFNVATPPNNFTVSAQTSTTITASSAKIENFNLTTNFTGTKSGDTFTLTSAAVAGNNGGGCYYNTVYTLTGTIASFGCATFTEMLIMTSEDVAGRCNSGIDNGMINVGDVCSEVYRSPTCTAQ